MPTNPIRVLIVEDEAPARKALLELLSADDDVVVVGETWGARAVDAIRDAAPDLIFLDVRMPGMGGLEVLRRLDPAELPAIVFVTAHEEHAVEAFEVRALDYLLKPFTDQRFRESLERAKKQVQSRAGGHLSTETLDLLERRGSGGEPGDVEYSRPDRIILEDGGSTIVLPPGRVTWVEASGPYVVVHAEGREYLVRTSLTSLEQRLAPRGFVRVHRSALVNLDHVREVQAISHGDAVVVLRDGARVKVSRSRREALEGRLRDLYGSIR